MNAVIIGSTVAHGNIEIYSMAANGEVTRHTQGDIMFLIPGFVDNATIARCHVEEAEHSSPTYVDPEMNEHEIAARVQVLKNISQLEKQVERSYQSIAVRTAQAVQALKLPLRDQWSKVSTNTIARMISRKGLVPAATMLSIHRYLMAHSDTFVASSTHLATQTFLVRPRNEIKNLAMVSRMIVQRDRSVLEFVEKAKQVIAVNGQERRPTKLNSASVTPHSDIVFSESEQNIIQFLKDFLRGRRTIQKDPYLVPVATLIRIMDTYSAQALSASVIRELLVKLGVITPWDDPINAMGATDLSVLNDTSASQIHASTRLGPEEFYPEDIVANIRHDFGDMPVYVMDDVGAEELDDGVSIERETGTPDCYWVHVHVADPTHLLHPTHTLARQAREILNSRYLIQGTMAMLPHSFVFNRGLSLGASPGSQPVMTFSFKVDGTGEIVDYAVRAGLVRNVKVLSYDHVDDVLGLPRYAVGYPLGAPCDMPPKKHSALEPIHLNELKALKEVTERLVSSFVRTGSFQLCTEKLEVYSPKGTPFSTIPDATRPHLCNGFPNVVYSILPNRLSGARQIVAECMKAAGRVASRFFRDLGLPAIRRAALPIKTKDSETQALLISNRDHEGCLDMSILRKTGSAALPGYYTLSTKAHDFLGIPDGEGYVRVTSPLRRYGDMVHHWQIKHALLGASEPYFDERWLKSFAAEMSLKETTSTKLQRRRDQFWALALLKRFHEEGKSIDGQNLRDNLDVTALRIPYVDSSNGRKQIRVAIPSLCLTGRVYDVPDTLDVNQTFKADCAEIHLGPEPAIFLKYRSLS